MITHSNPMDIIGSVLYFAKEIGLVKRASLTGFDIRLALAMVERSTSSTVD